MATVATAAPDFSQFRRDLVASLQGSGTIDHLKTQVRSHLLDEIKRRGQLGAPPDVARSRSLRRRALDSLVFAHLNACGYEYSASVFAPEASLGSEGGALTTSDIATALGVAESHLKAAAATGGGDADASYSPLAAAVSALAHAATVSTVTAASQTGAAEEVLLAASTLEERLRRVDEEAASAKAERAPPLAHQLQEHMLRYQRETDERAAKQLQAETRRLREVEAGKIRAEERAAARADVDKVLREQQGWQAKQLAAMRQREVAATEDLRKREAAFEASCYQHRQRMLNELEGLRAREVQLQGESDARARELASQAELLATQRTIVTRDAASHAKEREVELEGAQAQLAATEREQRITHQHKLLELARQKNELDEQLALAHAERDRSATATARSALTREQLASAQESLRQKEEEVARLSSERRQLINQMPALAEARNGLQAKVSEAEGALARAGI